MAPSSLTWAKTCVWTCASIACVQAIKCVDLCGQAEVAACALSLVFKAHIPIHMSTCASAHMSARRHLFGLPCEPLGVAESGSDWHAHACVETRVNMRTSDGMLMHAHVRVQMCMCTRARRDSKGQLARLDECPRAGPHDRLLAKMTNSHERAYMCAFMRACAPRSACSKERQRV